MCLFMRLDEYLKARGLTHRNFADLVGCEQPTISRFVARTRIPSAALMQRIMAVTNGEVTADDFFDPPATQQAAA